MAKNSTPAAQAAGGDDGSLAAGAGEIVEAARRELPSHRPAERRRLEQLSQRLTVAGEVEAKRRRQLERANETGRKRKKRQRQLEKAVARVVGLVQKIGDLVTEAAARAARVRSESASTSETVSIRERPARAARKAGPRSSAAATSTAKPATKAAGAMPALTAKPETKVASAKPAPTAKPATKAATAKPAPKRASGAGSSSASAGATAGAVPKPRVSTRSPRRSRRPGSTPGGAPDS
jgi:hypothetical protein